MKMINHLVRLFGGCAHDSTYLERRHLHGTAVMHLVCHDCGHAVPALQRTAREHRRVVQAGAVRMSHARRQSPAVVEMMSSRRHTA